jgi:hypothetical protein
MQINELEKQLAELKDHVVKQDRRIRRVEGAREILNVLARYVNYHSASDQTATVKLFCRHTSGIRLIFNGHIYDGWEGVERHFLYRMANAEQDLSGRIYWHDVVSPLIEVAADAMSAKCIVSTHGAETGWNKDGSLKSLWSWGRYRFDFLKEDGEWRIYRLEFHQCMNTPYEGKGWVEEPCYDLIGNAPEYLKKDPDPRTLPHRVTKKPYLPLSVSTPDCDLHNLIPALPEPYETYDFEGIKDEDDLDWHVR